MHSLTIAATGSSPLCTIHTPNTKDTKHSTLHSALGTLHTAQCTHNTLQSELCFLHTVHCTIQILQTLSYTLLDICTSHTAQFTHYTIQTLHTLDCTLLSVHCPLFTTHCKILHCKQCAAHWKLPNLTKNQKSFFHLFWFFGNKLFVPVNISS